MRKGLLLFLLMIGCGALMLVNAQSVSENIGRFKVETYDSEVYGAHPQNRCVAQGVDGLMYFGNVRGVLIFDGVTWRLVPVSNKSDVRAIAPIGEHKYIGARDELGKLVADEFGRMTYQSLVDKLPKEAFPLGDIDEIFEINGDVVFQGEEKLFLWNGSAFTVVSTGLHINGSFKIGNRLFISGEKSGMYEYRSNGLKKILSEEILAVGAMIEADGEILAFAGKQGIFKLDGDRLVLKRENQANENWNRAAKLPNGRYAVGSWGAGMNITNKEFKVLDQYGEHTLQDPNVNSFFLDRSGMLWLALNNGIAKVEVSNQLTYYTEFHGLKGTIENITTFNGRLLFASSAGIGYINEKNKISYYKSIKTECWDVKSMVIDGEEHCLYADNNGIHELMKDGSTKKVLTCLPFTLFPSETEVNRIYVGLEPGLTSLLFENGRWTEQKMEGVDIVARFIDQSDETIWIGSDFQGAMKLEIKNGEVVDLSRYKDSNLIAGSVHPMFGEHWNILGGHEGTYALDGDSLKVVNVIPGDGAVVRISEDADQSLWVVRHDDEKKIGLQVIHEHAHGKFAVVQHAFDELKGKMVYAIHHAGPQTWLGGPNLLVAFDQRSIRSYDQPFATLVREVRNNRDSVINYGGASFGGLIAKEENVLPYDRNAMSFSYAGLSYEAPDLVSYSYRLIGYKDTSWSVWSSKHSCSFTNLAEGHYMFEVKSKNLFGQEGKLGRYRFEISSPWYRTWWAFGLYVLVFVLIIKGAVSISTKGLQIIVDEKTAEVVKQREEITIQRDLIQEKNRDIIDSINYAERIQVAMMPKEKNLKAMLPESFVLFKPKDIVSGDFYWAAKVSSVVYWTAADCTGHGVPGALMSMISSSLLRQMVVEKKVSAPGEILDGVRAGLVDSLEQGEESNNQEGLDAGLCGYNTETRELQFSGGNNSCYLVRPSEVALIVNGTEHPAIMEVSGLKLYEVKADKMPIGYYPGGMRPFKTNLIETLPGDTVYLSSDGFADQFGGAAGKKFKTKSFKRLLLNVCTHPMARQEELLRETIVDWMAGYEQIDDICVMGVKL